MFDIAPYRDYLTLEKKYSNHTVMSYTKDVMAFVAFLERDFGALELDIVEYREIRAWIVDLVDTGLSNQSINRKISSLNSYYKYLQKIGQRELSPLIKHKALKTPKVIQIPFSSDEMSVLLDDVDFPDTYVGKRDKLIVDLFYSTGLRRAELIELRVEDIDFSNRMIKVVGKRDKQRIVPLLDGVINAITLFLDARSVICNGLSTSFLFLTSKGDKMYHTLVYRIINNYLSMVTEKKKKSPHMLRHTFATHMLNNGADMNSIKELLGHASLASTQVYTNNSLSELKKVYKGAHPRNKK